MTRAEFPGADMPRLRLLRRWTWRGRLAGLIGRSPRYLLWPTRRPTRRPIRRPIRRPARRPARVAGLWLGPCAAVHTFGMRYAIDVIFLDHRGHVIRCVPALPPWRWAVCMRAVSVVEFESGLVCLDDRGISGIEAAVRNAAQGNFPRDLHRADHSREPPAGHHHAEAASVTHARGKPCGSGQSAGCANHRRR